MTPMKARIDKLLVACGHAINANNGKCAVIEDALCETTTLLLDLEKVNADLLASCEKALACYDKACAQGYSQTWHGEDVDAMRVAVSKAKGEST